MRQELRYQASIKNDDGLIQYLYSIGNCLKYKVNNFYLDDNTKQYGKTDSGSPRFRVRLYEVDEFCFGNIELKYKQTDNGYTYKNIWNINQYWDTIVSLIPSLAEKELQLPTDHSIYQILISSSNPEKLLDIDRAKHIDTLSYHRLSCAFGNSRITIDSSFCPLIISENSVILEWKGIYDKNTWQNLEHYCEMKQITDLSKFTLLSRLKQ